MPNALTSFISVEPALPQTLKSFIFLIDVDMYSVKIKFGTRQQHLQYFN